MESGVDLDAERQEMPGFIGCRPRVKRSPAVSGPISGEALNHKQGASVYKAALRLIAEGVKDCAGGEAAAWSDGQDGIAQLAMARLQEKRGRPKPPPMAAPRVRVRRR